MLFNMDGSLLATVGIDASAEKNTAASISAIMANIWSSFEKAGDAQIILLDCEVSVVPVRACACCPTVV
jgi:hypothetical protein